MMQRIDARCVMGSLSAILLCLTVSCTGQQSVQMAENENAVPFTPLSTLEMELSLNRGPTLVEFVQDFNCARCDQMASTMDDLRAGFAKDVSFHRVNYLAAVNQFQLGICPTYMFVLDGEVVGQLSGKQPYPILTSRLDELVTDHQRRSKESPIPFEENENEAERKSQ